MLKDSINYIHKKLIPLSVTIICLYALYLRIVHLSRHLTLWGDEIHYLRPMSGTFLDFLRDIPNVEFCSYLSGDLFIFYPFFKIFSFNKWGLTIPCVISTILGFYILYLVCKRYLKSIWGYLIVFSVVCFNATLINHATEIRTYAFLPTIALATFYLFQRIADLNFKLNALKMIGAVTFFVLVIWFHIFGILIFTSSFLFVLLSKRRESDFKIYFKNAVSFTVITLCFAAPLWLYSIFGRHLDYSQLSSMNIATFDYIPNPLYNIIGFLKGIFGNLVGFKKLYFLLPGLLIPVVFSYRERYEQLIFLISVIFIPLAAIFISDIIQHYWFIQRQFVWLMPLFAFFLGWSWDSLIMTLTAFIKNAYAKK